MGQLLCPDHDFSAAICAVATSKSTNCRASVETVEINFDDDDVFLLLPKNSS